MLDNQQISAIGQSLVINGDKILMGFFNKLHSLKTTKVKDKNKLDYQTEADLEMEAELEKSQAEIIPGVVFVGEEACDDDYKKQALVKKILAADHVTINDALDGTFYFRAGKPSFCCQTAYAYKGNFQVAWIYQPVEKILLEVVVGQSVKLTQFINNGSIELPVRQSYITSNGQKPKITGHIEGVFNSISPEQQARIANNFEVVPHICASMDTLNLATGKTDALLYANRKPWDVLPSLVLAQHYGGWAGFAENGAEIILENMLSYDDSPYFATIMPVVEAHKWRMAAL